MGTFATLPKLFASRLVERIEEHGVPAMMLRGDGQLNPDGIRDYDLLIPASALEWAEATFAAERTDLLRAADAWRADLRARGIDYSIPGPDGQLPLAPGEMTPTEKLTRLAEARRRRRRERRTS